MKNLYLSGLILLLTIVTIQCSTGDKDQGNNSPVKEISRIESLNTGEKWCRCFMSNDGTIYFKDSLLTRDAGRTLLSQHEFDPKRINGAPERAVLTTSNGIYALDGPVSYVEKGVYRGVAWRSADNLKNFARENPVFYIPEGAGPISDTNEWYGIYVYRTILAMPDSTWLMTLYGNFVADTIVPNDLDAKKETKYLQRTIIVSSRDEGRTWYFLSVVAAPEAGMPLGEGFVEPALTRLKDGRLLCILRSGHHYPLWASWSSDDGRTWTTPVYTGLDRGCDPCLITLRDGRVALSWGKRFPEGWSDLSKEGDKGRFKYPGQGYTNLAISNDGGATWINRKIIPNAGSCYTTIFETAPNEIFMQTDQWFCRIKLKKL